MSTIPLPAVVKRPLVKVWNTSYGVARVTRDYLAAIANGRIERCSVCGKLRPMFFRPRYIAPRLIELWGLTPRQTLALARKESSDCSACGAKLRARRLAQVLLDLYPVGAPGATARAESLSDWSRSPQARGMRIAEVNVIDGLHDVLKGLPGFKASDFTPGVEPGATVDGVRCEDFTRLTYPDASFDLVLTSETHEHVPDLPKAFAEGYRVLVPGGLQVLTAPVSPNAEKTYTRSRLRPDGSVEHLAPSISHPGGDWGYPVFTELGKDFPDLLRQAGFEVEIRFGPLTDDDFAQVYICRKPE